MSETPLKKSFFQDLWDRRFFQFVGTYLGVSFGLIEFSEFIENRYNPGVELVDKLAIFLLILLPAVIVFIYNHGRKGADEWKPFEKVFIPINTVIAVGLATLLFNSASETISITNESGEIITRQVPKARFAKRLVIFPFTNNTGAEENNWLRVAGPYLLDKDLEQDMRIFSTQPLSLKRSFESYNQEYLSEIPFATQLKIAQDYYSDYFITGELTRKEGGLTLKARVINTNNGDEFYSQEFTGNSIYEIIDLFNADLNDHFYLPEMGGKEQIIDLPVSNLLSTNIEAVKNFIEASIVSAQNTQNVGRAIELMEKAVELDGRCTECYSDLSELYFTANMDSLSKMSTNKAISLSGSLPERQKLNIQLRNYRLHNEVAKQIILLENWKKLYPMDYTPYRYLMAYNQQILEWDKAKVIGNEALDIGHKGNLLIDLARLYINTSEYDEAENLVQQFADLYPHKSTEISLLAEIYSSKGELDKARSTYEELLVFEPNNIGLIIKLSTILDKLGNFKESWDNLNRALSVSNQVQDSISVYAQMETHYHRLGQYKSSFEIIEKREPLMKKIYPPITALQSIYFTYIPHFIQNNQLDEVLRRKNEILGMAPQAARLINCVSDFLVYATLEDVENFDKTIEDEFCSSAMLQYGPNFSMAINSASARIRKDYKAAAEILKSYIDSTGVAGSLLSSTYVEVLRLSGQLDKALEVCEKQLKGDPNQPLYLIEYAKLMKEFDKQKEAEEVYNKAMAIWKNADESYKLFADARDWKEELLN